MREKGKRRKRERERERKRRKREERERERARASELVVNPRSSSIACESAFPAFVGWPPTFLCASGSRGKPTCDSQREMQRTHTDSRSQRRGRCRRNLLRRSACYHDAAGLLVHVGCGHLPVRRHCTPCCHSSKTQTPSRPC